MSINGKELLNSILDYEAMAAAKTEEHGKQAYYIERLGPEGKVFTADEVRPDAYSLTGEGYPFKGYDNIEVVQQEGGGEGGTEWAYSIIRVDDKYYRAEYSYYSYDGYDFYNFWTWEEVEPTQVTITKYEKVS